MNCIECENEMRDRVRKCEIFSLSCDLCSPYFILKDPYCKRCMSHGTSPQHSVFCQEFNPENKRKFPSPTFGFRSRWWRSRSSRQQKGDCFNFAWWYDDDRRHNILQNIHKSQRDRHLLFYSKWSSRVSHSMLIVICIINTMKNDDKQRGTQPARAELRRWHFDL